MDVPICSTAKPAHGQVGVNLQQVPPRFPPELWNVHEATVNGAPPTNNQCEGWNNIYFHLVGYSLQTCFLALCQDRVAGRRTIGEFLTGIWHNIRWNRGLKCYYRPTASLQLNNNGNTKYNITVT